MRSSLRASLRAAAVLALLPAVLTILPASPASADALGGAGIAFQDRDHNLTTVTSDRALHHTGLGMAAGTSPSLVQVVGGGYWTDMQANTGVLWRLNPQFAGQPLHANLAPGTSPAIHYDPNESPQFREYFQNSAGKLGEIWSLTLDPVFAANSMAPGSSPDGNGDYESRQNRVVPSVSLTDSSDLTMAPATSPSSANHDRFTSWGTYAVAWQGQDNYLMFTVGDTRGNSLYDTSWGMMPGTSPDVAIGTDGRYVVAFQANNGILWTVSKGGNGEPQAVPTNLGMDHASSPSITALPAGGFEIAFQADNHTLWTVQSHDGFTWNGGVIPDGYMAPGTSPSIDAFIPPSTVPLTAPVGGGYHPSTIEALPCTCTGPTAGLNTLVNALRVHTLSVTSIVLAPAGLAVPNRTEISVLFNNSTRITQDYDPVHGNQIRFDFPVGDGQARLSRVDISLAEHGPGGVQTAGYLPTVAILPLFNVAVSALTFDLVNQCDGLTFGLFDDENDSEPRIFWNDDRGFQDTYYDNAQSFHPIVIQAFARLYRFVSVNDNVLVSGLGFQEEDPPIPDSIPGGFSLEYVAPGGPMLPGQSRTVAFSDSSSGSYPDASCNANFSYSITINPVTYAVL